MFPEKDYRYANQEADSRNSMKRTVRITYEQFRVPCARESIIYIHVEFPAIFVVYVFVLNSNSFTENICVFVSVTRNSCE